MELVDYYSERAPTYDEVYKRRDAARQLELQWLKEKLQRTFSDSEVLEIACGTGFWTEQVAQTAKTLLATDASTPMLAICRNRVGEVSNVTLLQSDAYSLEGVPVRSFNGAFAMCWFSHVPKTRHCEFLTQLHSRLLPGASVLIADNSYIPSLGGDLTPPNHEGDTFKLRELKGKQLPVLKNYFSEQDLKTIFTPYSTQLSVTMNPCFWSVHYILGSSSYNPNFALLPCRN